VQFLELQKLSDLDLDLGLGRSHIGTHIQRGLSTPNFMEIKTVCGWMDVRMDRLRLVHIY